MKKKLEERMGSYRGGKTGRELPNRKKLKGGGGGGVT